MDNPQELKKLIVKQLIEKKNYKKALPNTEGELRNLITKKLVEDGDYETVLKSISADEKSQKLEKLLKPMSALSDILTENTNGVLMEELRAQLTEATDKNSAELRTSLEEAQETLKTELQDVINSNWSELSTDVLSRVTEAQEALKTALSVYADDIVTKRADALFATLSAQAKLTPEEIEQIIESSALSVESQIADIVGDYIGESGITTDQIKDFDKAVKKLLPKAQQVTWESIVGKPDISPGGTNANLVKALIAEALANFDGGGAVDSVNGQTGVVNLAISDLTDVTKSATAPINPQVGDLWIDIS